MALGAEKDGVERAFAAFKKVIDFAVWDQVAASCAVAAPLRAAGESWNQVAEARSHFVECLPAIMSYADRLGGENYVRQIMTMITDQYTLLWTAIRLCR
jgi:hypothetical protein